MGIWMRKVAIGIWLVAACANAPAEAPKARQSDKPLSALEQQRQSASRQMQAIRQHYPSLFPEPANLVAGPPVGDCPAVTPTQVKPIIEGEAARHRLDARLIEAVVEAESAYFPCAVSRVGAMGLMQLMPSTAETLRVTDAFDPLQNIAAGTQYLKQMLERYKGDLAKALAAYNAGPARVDAAGGVPPIPETRDYVRRVIERAALPPALPVE